MDNRCVYILKWKRHYIWSTNNLERRLCEHREWNTSTTKRIWERQLIKVIKCNNKKEARDLESKIKKDCHVERYLDMG